MHFWGEDIPRQEAAHSTKRFIPPDERDVDHHTARHVNIARSFIFRLPTTNQSSTTQKEIGWRLLSFLVKFSSQFFSKYKSNAIFVKLSKRFARGKYITCQFCARALKTFLFHAVLKLAYVTYTCKNEIR